MFVIRCLETLFALTLVVAAATSQGRVDFSREIRPILAEHCFACHGPDAGARKAELRLDVDPGPRIKTAMLERTGSRDPKHVMPPPSADKALSVGELAKLRAWVESGGRYAKHWSLVAPQRPVPPRTRQDWQRNPIDGFIAAQLERHGLEPSPEADPATLLRRVYLDLIGLPPTPDEVEAFLRDARPGAWERVVDRLLASPHYGERWARRWLDLARYADTNGYEKDRPRSMWLWRDWVIDALNADMPFDRFTIEQLAGDMLPDATPAQRIATGFHRNTMLNQEGGIDVEEFRFEAVVDRVGTTGTTWLGLTVGCAQCHSHKFDPITQRDYYGLFAFLNNCDELVMPVVDPRTTAKRKSIAARIASLDAGLRARFPLPQPDGWRVVRPVAAEAKHAKLAILADDSVQAGGPSFSSDTYTLDFEGRVQDLAWLRVEALVDARDSCKGPGRTPHGNFVLSGVKLYAVGPRGTLRALPFASAHADFAQPGYPAAAAIDGKNQTGWAIHGPTQGWRRNRSAWFETKGPVTGMRGSRFRVVLEQSWGGQHTLSRVRISVSPKRGRDGRARREKNLRRHFRRWLAAARKTAVRWDVVVPAMLRSKGKADFQKLGDGSILVYGNNPDRDTTTLALESAPGTVRALRLEALPDPSLPLGGPGRSPFFPEGGFMLSDLRVRAATGRDAPWRDVVIDRAWASFEPPDNRIAHAIDDKPDTGWTNAGNVGRRQFAVFAFKDAVDLGVGGRIEVTLRQHSIHNNNLGRFRVALTRDTVTGVCRLSAEHEARVASGSRLDPETKAGLMREFLRTTPLLRTAHAEIEKLRKEMPRQATTLILEERDAARRRTTHVHHRGQFLQTREVVEPATPAALPGLPRGAPRNRLSLARWLVSRSNPLTARVVMNRHFEALFGRGIVRTTEDFGTRGAAPTHPQLLDWLATEFMRRGWSQKAMHRLIVTSATYRQSSRVSPANQARDPENLWLSRMSRVRLDAELIRDLALRASGLLSEKIGGPSVFPPQPAGVGDLSYGRLVWKTSEGVDRYRRGLYTYAKRTAPYAMFALFDAPSGEACVARRERSNTPLQALTLLNDPVFVECARALGRQLAEATGTDDAKLDRLYMSVLSRPVRAGERADLRAFLAATRRRAKDAVAAWSAVARAVLNLDEAITKG